MADFEVYSPKLKPKASFKDRQGRLYVDCAECRRGGNGNHDCSAGSRLKKVRNGGCFSGVLLAKFEVA